MKNAGNVNVSSEEEEVPSCVVHCGLYREDKRGERQVRVVSLECTGVGTVTFNCTDLI